MKKLVLAAAAVALASSPAFAWVDDNGHWVENPSGYAAACPPYSRPMLGAPYGPQCVPYAYPPIYSPPAYYAPPVVMAPPSFGFSIGPHGRFSFGIGL